MPMVNINFAGQTLVLPGAYYQDQLSGFNSAIPTTPPLIYIGYGYGVKPQTPTTFVTANDLLNAIRGGPASGYVAPITNPSPQLFGAQVITYINVGENTQSTAALKDGATSGVAIATSSNYGVPSNLLQISVGTGSLAGKIVSLFDGYSGRSIEGDNLGVPFQLAYTGAATGGVTFTVATSGLNATSFAVSSPNANESFTINIGAGEYSTVEQVVEYLNGTGFYTAVPIGDTSLPAAYLDSGQTATTLPPISGSLFQYVNITAALGSVLYWFNQYASAFFATAAASASISSYTSGLAPSNIPFTSFTGATSVPPVNNDYATALNNALAIPGWAVFCDSNMAAVRALGSAHAQTASTPLYGKWRRFYTGSTVGDSVGVSITNAQALNSNRSIYVYPGIYTVDPNTGLTVLQSGLYAAAAAAGMSTGNPPSTPLTNKVLNGVGVEVQLTISQINQLQQAGVMPLKGTTVPVSGTVQFNNVPPTIISDLTTWQNDNNPENVFEQQIKCRDFLAYSMVGALQPYVGTVADINNESKILSAAQLTLNSLIYTPGSQGVLASWDPNSLLVSYNGITQTASVSASVKLTGQNRFIVITSTIFPLNFTLSLSTAISGV